MSGISDAIAVTYNNQEYAILKDGVVLLDQALKPGTEYSLTLNQSNVFQHCTAAAEGGTIAAENVTISVQCQEVWFFTAMGTGIGNELYKTDGSESGTELVSDINEGVGSSKIQHFTRTTNGVVFAADNGKNGQELWVSDGTNIGTRMLKEFSAGNLASDIKSIQLMNGQAVINVTYNGGAKQEIWITDGSEAGTQSIWQYDGNSTTYNIMDIQIVGKSAIIAVDDRTNQSMLIFRTDGNASGNIKLAEYAQGIPGPTALLRFRDLGIAKANYFYMIMDYSVIGTKKQGAIWAVNETDPSASSISKFTFAKLEETQLRTLLGAAGDKVLLSLVDTVNSGGIEPFSFDPKVKTVSLFKNIHPTANSYPEGIGQLGGELVFTAYDGQNKLWITDSTANDITQLSDQIFLDPPEALRFFAQTDTLLFFLAYDPHDPSFRLKLWRTDGSKEGTHPVSSQPIDNSSISNLIYLGVSGGRVLFSANTPDTGQELWVTDGTEVGTHLVKDISPGSSSGLSSQPRISEIDNVVYFVAEQPGLGLEMWRSDGTFDGTSIVKDINKGSLRSSNPENLVRLQDNLFFSADDGLHGRELWVSDVAGLRMVEDINKPNAGVSVDASSHSAPGQLVASTALLYFVANDGVNGRELWRSDGFETYLVKDIRPGAADSGIKELTAFGNQVYFTADDGSSATNNQLVWRSDGSANATAKITGSVSGGAIYSAPHNLTVAGSVLYYAATDTYGEELWTIVGATPKRVSDINTTTVGTSAQKSSNPAYLFPLAGSVLFQANDAINGVELWLSDGTVTGTSMISDIAQGPSGSNPRNFMEMDGAVYFTAYDPVTNTGNELYKTNALAGGLNVTELVMDIVAGNGGSDPGQFTVMQNASGKSLLFFSAFETVTGVELWVTDGTVTGLVKDIYPGTSTSNVSNLVAMGNRLYFSADDGANGAELWTSDGTNAGTYLVKDIYSGKQGSDPSELTVVGSKLFFAATDSVAGRELWQSDGAELGTTLVGEINTNGDAFQ